MELGTPLIIKDFIAEYSGKDLIKMRLERCAESGEVYAIPIKSLQLYTNPISINDLKSIDTRFKIPRGYLDITKYEVLYKYLKSQTKYSVEFYNDHNTIYEENIGSKEDLKKVFSFFGKNCDAAIQIDDTLIFWDCLTEYENRIVMVRYLDDLDNYSEVKKSYDKIKNKTYSLIE